MTLLHVTLSKARALIATDTAVYVSDHGEPGADVLYHADGTAVSMTKVYALPHVRAVLTGRGTSTVHAFAFERVRYARDFEHAVDLLADGLPRLALAPSLAGTYKGKPLQHSVYLVGWSDAHGAMCRASFESATGYRPTVTPAGSGWQGLYDPWVPHPAWVFDPEQSEAHADERRAYFEAERERDPRCLTTAAAYARHAVEYARSQDPRAPFGGHLLVAELTRDSVQIVDAGDLGLPWRRPGAPDLMDARGVSTSIQPGAATEVDYGTTAGPVTDPGDGLTHDIVTLTFTPSAGGVLSCFASYDADSTAGAWTEGSYGTRIQVVQGASTTNAPLRGLKNTRITQQVELSVSVAAGTSVTVKLQGIAPEGFVTHWWNARLQYELIKR